jgi:predicted TIM-barrel fold metal-dependent hydrolase
MPDGSKATVPEAVAQHLFTDEDISVAILNGALFHPSKMTQSPEFVTAIAGAYNDWEADKWLGADERFRGSIHVIASDPEWSVREIERMAEHPQMVQVFLPTVTDREYGDPALFPIYEAAERHGLTLAMHHGSHSLTLFGYPRYFIEWHLLAAPSAAQHQLASLITNGMFDKFEQLKVVFLECSIAWVPWFMWRLDEQYKELRQEIPWVRKLPSRHIRERVRFSTQPMSDLTADRFLKLIDLVETDEMFMFSTDYPHFDADTWDETFTSTIGEDLLHRVAYKNALATYPRLASLQPE